ncbi:MAG: Holliday junction branch migration protein RuvA [Gemmataceae bacterium]
MITAIRGKLRKLLDEEARLEVGPLDYQVLVPEFVHRQLQSRVGEEVELLTIHYFEGNPMQGKVIPRLIGFVNEAELEFFELFCTADGVGTRKAIKALARPPQEVARAIQQEDGKWLSTLPGIGKASADKIIAALKTKVVRFAMALGGTGIGGHPATAPMVGKGYEEALQALLTLGHNPADARGRLDKAHAVIGPNAPTEDILREIYRT